MKQTFGQTYQNYEQQDLKILIFKAIFQHQKLVESFQKKVLVKKYFITSGTYINEIFLKTLIF